MLPTDLKDYRADDAFSLISPDLAVLLICVGGVILLILWPRVG